MNDTHSMKTMPPNDQLELCADEAALALALQAALRQRAQTLHLAPAVRAHVLAAVVPRRDWNWWWRPVCAAAAAACVLLTVLFFALKLRRHPVAEFTCLITIPDHTVRTEWKSPTHVVIQRSAGWQERRLMVSRYNGTDAYGLFVARPAASLWK